MEKTENEKNIEKIFENDLYKMIIKYNKIKSTPYFNEIYKSWLDCFFNAMKKDENRLKSFSYFKNYFDVPIKQFVDSGFFYYNDRDCVQCFKCRGVLCNWKPYDVPLSEHYKHFPNCSFIYPQ